MKEFIALHNRTVSRDEIQTVIALAKEKNNTEVIYRLSKILNDHPDSKRFNINIINYPQETTQQVALAGTRHSGDYREALDECGRLRKGWKFVKGNVIKVEKKEKPKKEAKPKKEKTPKKETKKDKKYKFVVITDDLPSRVIAVFSYTNPNIEELREGFWKNSEGKYYETTEEGLRNYTFGIGFYPFEKAKKHIEKKYTERKDFIYFRIEKDGDRDKAISLVEKPKKEAKPKKEKTKEKATLEVNNPEKSPKTPTDKSAPSDSSTTTTNTPTIATTLIASSTQPTRIRLSVENSKQEENYDKIADKNGFINAEKLKQLLEVWKKDKDFYFEEGFINPADFAKTAPASKEKGIFTLKNIVSKDKLRPILTGVFIEKDKYVATDAMNLLIVKRPKNDGLKTGTIYDPTPEPQYSKSYRGTAPFADDQTIQNSRYIDGNFPKYQDVVNIPNYKVKMFELAPIINTLYASLEIGKRIHTEDYRMVININGKESGYFMSVKLLFNALQALKANGSEKAMFLISKNGFIYIISDNGNIALTVSAKGYDGSVREHFIQLPTIELTVPKEFVPDTKATLNAPNGLFGKYPEIDTARFKKMKVSELRTFTMKYYNLYLKGDSATIEKYVKEVVFINTAGRKIAYGEAMYSAKAAVIAHLKTLIKNSTYNNWGERKASDGKDVLGYLNFKSKITIDNKKRHVRISLVVYKDRRTELKNVEVGKNKKVPHFAQDPVGTLQDGRNETLSTESVAKTIPNNSVGKKKSQAPKGTLPSAEGAQLSTNTPAKIVPKNKKSASFRKATVVNPQDGRNETLSTESVAKTVPNSALSAPEVFVEHSPDPATQSAPYITPRNNSIANKMATLQNHTFETFIIAEPQMQAFLGDVERKNTGSTAITITGGAGSGKTRFAFQFINALAQNYKVGHASLEEQPDSKLYFDKVQQYLDQTAQANVEAPEIENMQDLQALIERNDVIVIDSFTKIREWDRNFLLDRDLRKKYNGKLFLIIFQQTVAGNMRGGTTSEFDGDIILYTQVFPDYRENYIYPSKNRYNSTPSEQLRYSVYHQQLLPSESTPSDSSPVTSNTYEVIY